MGGGGPEGELTVKIISGKSLDTKSFSGKCNSFCTVCFENQSFNTNLIKNSINPNWNEEFTFEIFTKPSQQISLSVWEKGPFPGQDECLGTMVIGLDFSKSFSIEKEQELITKGKSNSCLIVSLTYNYFGN